MNYRSLNQLIDRCTTPTLSELILAEESAECGISVEQLLEKMNETYDVMLKSIEAGKKADCISTSGLSYQEAYKLVQCPISLCGDAFKEALSAAVAVALTNASMGKIVAAPTAGSCGVLPAAIALVNYQQVAGRKTQIKALFTAAAVAEVIAAKASVSGAEGGCQAEIGSASAMAAAFLVECYGGTIQMIGHAVALALQNMMGLVCDPVAGLVEIPCIHRNAAGISNAMTAAQLALASVHSPIPVDEVIQVMKQVGDQLPSCLKETSEGGLAVSDTAQQLAKQVRSCSNCHKCQ